MKAKLLGLLIELVLKAISPESVKEGVAKALDWIEEKVEDSETKIDDITVLPLVQLIREAFDI